MNVQLRSTTPLLLMHHMVPIQKKTNKNRELKPSGAIVLCIAVIESRSKDHTNTWGEEELHTLKQCKPNIVTKTTQHFGSSGLIYSFGNRGNFGMINNSSIPLMLTANLRI